MSYGALLEKTDRGAKQFIRAVLNGSQLSPDRIFSRPITPGQAQALDGLRTRILDIDRRLGESKEIDALLTGFDGKYIPLRAIGPCHPGP